MDYWKTTFLLGRPIFRGYVSSRDGIKFNFQQDQSPPRLSLKQHVQASDVAMGEAQDAGREFP